MPVAGHDSRKSVQVYDTVGSRQLLMVLKMRHALWDTVDGTPCLFRGVQFTEPDCLSLDKSSLCSTQRRLVCINKFGCRSLTSPSIEIRSYKVSQFRLPNVRTAMHIHLAEILNVSNQIRNIIGTKKVLFHKYLAFIQIDPD